MKNIINKRNREINFRPERGLKDILMAYVYNTSVEILVMFKNGDKKLLQEYHIEGNKIYNLYWLYSMSRRKKQCILIDDIKELIIQDV